VTFFVWATLYIRLDKVNICCVQLFQKVINVDRQPSSSHYDSEALRIYLPRLSRWHPRTLVVSTTSLLWLSQE